MAEEETQALNVSGDADKESTEGEISPILQEDKSDDGLVNTVDESPVDTEPEGANNTEDASEKETSGETDQDGQDTRYDKDPRWIKIREDAAAATERATKAEARVEALEKLMAKDKTQQSQVDEADYTDMSAMEDDEIREMVDENPKGFFANVARQIRSEIMAEVKELQSQTTQEQEVLKTYDSYAKEHETFDPMWKSGEIERFMSLHPGHNAISAHQVLTSQKAIDEAVEKAKKETEAEVIKNFKLKPYAKSMGRGPGGRGVLSPEDEISAILKNSKKAGGAVAAGVRALRLRRAQAAKR